MTHEELYQLNPDLTPEVMKQIDKVIEENIHRPGCLIPVLTKCQEILGYIPVELQEYLSEKLNIPGSNIYGVVSFYSFFSMIPKGRHTIKICEGTACYVQGSYRIRDFICNEYGLEPGGTTEDRRFSLQVVRCLGACGLAPVMMVDNDTYGKLTIDNVKEILDRYE